MFEIQRPIVFRFTPIHKFSLLKPLPKPKSSGPHVYGMISAGRTGGVFFRIRAVRGMVTNGCPMAGEVIYLTSPVLQFG